MQIEPTGETLLCGCGSVMSHETDLEVIRHDVWELKTKVLTLIELVEAIQAECQPVMNEIIPMIDEIANGPIGSMLGLKRKG